MKALRIAQKADQSLNELTEHALSLERDVMLLKKGLRLLASKMAFNEDGRVDLSITPEDEQTLKYVVEKCDVFGTGGT